MVSGEFHVPCTRECMLGVIHSSIQQIFNNGSLANGWTFQPKFLLWKFWLVFKRNGFSKAGKDMGHNHTAFHAPPLPPCVLVCPHQRSFINGTKHCACGCPTGLCPVIIASSQISKPLFHREESNLSFACLTTELSLLHFLLKWCYWLFYKEWPSEGCRNPSKHDSGSPYIVWCSLGDNTQGPLIWELSDWRVSFR